MQLRSQNRQTEAAGDDAGGVAGPGNHIDRLLGGLVRTCMLIEGGALVLTGVWRVVYEL